MRASAQTITVQANTRVPEAPLDIPLDEADTGCPGTTARPQPRPSALGSPSGVGTFFGILAILAASFDD